MSASINCFAGQISQSQLASNCANAFSMVSSRFSIVSSDAVIFPLCSHKGIIQFFPRRGCEMLLTLPDDTSGADCLLTALTVVKFSFFPLMLRTVGNSHVLHVSVRLVEVEVIYLYQGWLAATSVLSSLPPQSSKSWLTRKC